MLQEDVGTCVGLGFPDTGRPISPDLQDAKWLSLVANNSRPSRFREVPSFNIAGAQNLVSTHGLLLVSAQKAAFWVWDPEPALEFDLQHC